MPTPAAAITEILDRFRPLPVAVLPTPLQEMSNLRAALGPRAPRLLIKRDDLTGIAMGGNKARKLAFLLADARAANCDTLITCGAAQSNHSVQTAAAARRFGFAVRCVLDIPTPGPEWAPSGNLILHRLLGTEIRWAETEPGETRADARTRVMTTEAAAVRAAGGRPYIIPTGGSTAIGALGYVQAVVELAAQLYVTDAGVPDAIYFASGSGGTHAGIAVGIDALGLPIRAIGVAVEPAPIDAHGTAPFQREIESLMYETAGLIGVPLVGGPPFLETCFGGPAYGAPTVECEEAMGLLAGTEGIFVDPIYTGKALSALISHIRHGRYTRDQTLLFVHTGGVAGLFAAH